MRMSYHQAGNYSHRRDGHAHTALSFQYTYHSITHGTHTTLAVVASKGYAKAHQGHMRIKCYTCPDVRVDNVMGSLPICQYCGHEDGQHTVRHLFNGITTHMVVCPRCKALIEALPVPLWEE